MKHELTHEEIAQNICELSKACCKISPDRIIDIVGELDLNFRELEKIEPAIVSEFKLKINENSRNHLQAGAYESFIIQAMPDNTSFTVGHFPVRDQFVSQVIMQGSEGSHVSGVRHIACSILAAYLRALAVRVEFEKSRKHCNPPTSLEPRLDQTEYEGQHVLGEQ